MKEADLPTGFTTAGPAESNRRPRKRELKNLTKRQGIWYFHKLVNGKKEFNGRHTPFSLETRDLALAKARRDAILKAGTGAEINRILGREDRGAATLGEVFAAYRAAPTVRASAATRERNIADLVRAVRLVKGEACAAEQLSTAELTKAFVKEWQTRKRELARLEIGEDLAAMEAVKRGLNSLLTHIQSLFSKEALDDYGRLYLPPNVDDFRTALPIAARKQEPPRQLADDFVGQLLADVEQLRRESPAVWAAFQLMVWGGLRNKECVHARESWLEAVPLGYRLAMKPTKDFIPKGNSRAVILPANIVEAMLEQLPAGPPAEGSVRDEYLVPAKTKTGRVAACYRGINAWLKDHGVAEDAGKIAYRLRKYFLAKISEQQGLMMAQAAAGHSSFRTTQDHYVGTPTMKEPVKIGAGA